ncbi:MAG: hypothetical protein L0J85_07675, partial [Tetragenococcus koreensis]|nr:hypothetical protein [Tetragenococcus koreensis]
RGKFMDRNKLIRLFESISLSINIEDIELNLPIAFSARYDLAKASISDVRFEFMLIKEKRHGSIESFIKQAERISKEVNKPYILVFSEIESKTRSLLLKARIPFVDYKGNFFIPDLGLVLNKELPIFKEQQFSPSEQLVIIYLLLKDYRAINPEQISFSTGVSVPTVYRALKTFVARNWLQSGYGEYSFKKEPIEVYNESSKVMINPVKRKVFVDFDHFETLKKETYLINNMKLAGLAALSNVSMLSKPASTYAVSNKIFNKLIKENSLNKKFIFEKQIGNSIEIQLWKYDPFTINDKEGVDPISLFLSLRDVNDPRVEIELDNLNNNIKLNLEERHAY